MKNNEHFWWTTLTRGFLALLIGSVIMVVRDIASTLLLLPIAIVISILSLAVYGVLDSVLVFVTSYMAASQPAKVALRMQGIVGVTVGILLYWLFFDRVRLHWFLVLIAVQAFSTAIAAFLVAQHSVDAFDLPGKWCRVMGVPHWILLPPGVWLVGRWVVRRGRAWRRRRRGWCLNCGYDLRTAAGVCPECGVGNVAINA